MSATPIGSCVTVDLPSDARMAGDPRFVTGICTRRYDPSSYGPDATLILQDPITLADHEVSEAWVHSVGQFFNLGQSAYRMFLMRALGIQPKGTAIPKLPASGTAFNVALPGGFEVYLKQQGPKLDRGHRMKHRIFVVCTCGDHIPAGRMRQHWDGAKHREEA